MLLKMYVFNLFFEGQVYVNGGEAVVVFQDGQTSMAAVNKLACPSPNDIYVFN